MMETRASNWRLTQEEVKHISAALKVLKKLSFAKSDTLNVAFEVEPFKVDDSSLSALSSRFAEAVDQMVK